MTMIPTLAAQPGKPTSQDSRARPASTAPRTLPGGALARRLLALTDVDGQELTQSKEEQFEVPMNSHKFDRINLHGSQKAGVVWFIVESVFRNSALIR